jgi:ABC-type cobalamin transport system permease subunit
MIYTLFIWTIVGFAGTSSSIWKQYDWRPIAEVHQQSQNISTLQQCEEVARQLGIDKQKYRCVRTK